MHKRLAALFFTLGLMSACTFSARPIYIEDEKKTAERTIALMHERMNAEQYEALYDDTHEVFKSAMSKAAAVASMRQTHERTGKILQVTQHWLNYVKGDPLPVRAIYNLKCEHGEFGEMMAFSISKDGQKALLAHYEIFPGSAPTPKTDQQ